jgi:anti-anti-sigma factor
MEMNIDKTQSAGKTVVTLTGRLDSSSAPQLQEMLISEFDTAKEIVLDFANLAYVSSAGLRVLLTGQKTAKAKGASMTVRGASDEIMEVFEMTGFTDMLTIV